MDAVIYNITDLKNEIERLKIAKQEQEIVLKSHFSSPSAIFHTVTSFLKAPLLPKTRAAYLAIRIL